MQKIFWSAPLSLLNDFMTEGSKSNSALQLHGPPVIFHGWLLETVKYVAIKPTQR